MNLARRQRAIGVSGPSRPFAALLAVVLCGLSAAADAQTTTAEPGPTTAPALPSATGVVFEDVNGNRRRDPGEPGLAGVSVSNGLEVTRTGPDGGYSLPVAEGDVLFVTKPRGYAPRLLGRRAPKYRGTVRK